MKQKLQIFKIMTAGLLCLSVLSGCASSAANQKTKEVTPMKPEESNAISYDFIGGKDVMPLQGFYGPYPSWVSYNGNTLPNYFDEKYFQMIAEAGINVINYSDANYVYVPTMIEQSMDYCEKYGMGYFVLDNRVSSNDGKVGDDEVNAAQLSEYIAEYADHPSFCGVFLIDEPRTGYFMPALGGQKDIARHGDYSKLLQYELDLNVYLNAFPVIDYNTKKEAYEKYIVEYCDTLEPKYLMWDYYPFYPSKDNDELYAYFWNMSLVREEAMKRNIPFMAAIQAGSQWNDEHAYFDSKTPYWPDEGQFNWNVNTCLAFGVQGFSYFPLIQPEHFAWAGTEKEPSWDSNRNGVIGALGNKTRWYYYVQNINKHIAVIDEVLMNSVSKGIIINGESAKENMKMTNCVIESGEFQELLSVNGDTIVGCFNYNGKTALYVVNHSMEYAQNITLNFNDTHNITMMQNAETSYVKAKDLTLDMAAGEGVLLVIE